jgi:hypothetical protein
MVNIFKTQIKLIYSDLKYADNLFLPLFDFTSRRTFLFTFPYATIMTLLTEFFVMLFFRATDMPRLAALLATSDLFRLV